MPLDPELFPHFDEAARLNNLDPLLLRALAMGESGGRANAVSPAGALGLMQIMPDTARQYGVADPHDPVQAIYGAANILNDHLTKAEAAKAAGANIVPVDHALKSYFGGDESGGGWGPKTAAYPGYIAGKYREMQAGGAPTAPANGIDALAAAKGPMPPPGTVASNVRPPPGTPDTFDAAPPSIAALAALSGQGTAPSALPANAGSNIAPGHAPPGVRFNSRDEPYTLDMTPQERANTVAAESAIKARDPALVARLSAPSPTANQLASAGGSDNLGGTPPLPMAPALPKALANVGATQVAQGVPLDDELLRMLNEAFPAKGSAAVTPPAATAPGGQVNPAAVEEANRNIVRNILLGRPVNPVDVEVAKRGPGMSGDPAYQAELKGAEAGASAAATHPFKMEEERQSQKERGQQARETAQFTATLNADPNAFNFSPSGTLPPGPGITIPIPIPASELHPLPSALPPLVDAAPIVGGKTYLEDKQKEWAKEENIWNAQRADNEVAIQRLGAMMEAMKQVQTGAYTTDLAHFRAALNAGGVHIADSVLPDPAEVQKILKNNFQAAIGTMKSTGNSRWTQRELQGAQDSMANPNLQPSANLAIGSQAIGTLKWENSKIDDWVQAKRLGWRDPTDFERAWVGRNPLQPSINQTEHDIGPLKGMVAPPTGPGQQNPPMPAPPVPGATMGSDGKWHMMINGQSHTLQPPAGQK